MTDVGVLAVNDPAVQENVRFSFETDVSRTGMVALAAVPADTDPPPVADAATYAVSVLGVTVIVGADTLPAGV